MRNRRIALEPSSPAQILALIEESDRFAALTGFPAAVELRSFFVSGEASAEWLTALRAGGGADPWRWGYFVVERAERLAIGAAGFKGPPDDEGVVEIAYAIVPEFQNRGHATEAAEALVDFASRDRGVKRIRAHTLPERNASTRVLQKCGFERIGTVVDPDDGEVWRWERAPAPP